MTPEIRHVETIRGSCISSKLLVGDHEVEQRELRGSLLRTAVRTFEWITARVGRR